MTFPPEPTRRIYPIRECGSEQVADKLNDYGRDAKTLHKLQELLRNAQELIDELQQQIDNRRR